LLVPAMLDEARAAESSNIGIEGNTTVELPRPDYRPRPLDDRTELILRVENVTKTPAGRYRYDFHYMGLEPGAYQLADYLVLPDGSPAADLGEMRLQVQAVLPEDHDGKLSAYLPRPFPFIGGYRAALGLLGVLWLGGIAWFAYSYRRRKPPAPPPPPAPAPTFAERLRPLVEAAAAGALSVEGKAQLERLLMGYWRDALRLPDATRVADALARLKQHPQAGAILRALERWLHQRGGADDGEIAGLLEPYRHGESPAGKGAPA
jgi:hypothetical protein